MSEQDTAADINHLIAERPRYALAARRGVLGRTWPAICDELLDHYYAVLGLPRETAFPVAKPAP